MAVPKPLPQGKFRTIYADPPWAGLGDSGFDRANTPPNTAHNQPPSYYYPTMPLSEIKALPITDLAADSCYLYLWAINNCLPDAFEVIDAWGFKYITCITWTKTTGAGMGTYFKGETEHCLFARRGKAEFKMTMEGIRCVSFTKLLAPRRGHSVKPPEMRDAIEYVSFPPYVELFARNQPPRENWTFCENKAEDLLKPE